MNVLRYVLQGHVVLPPDGLESVNNLIKFWARGREWLPTRSDNLGCISCPRVIVRDLRSSVILCGQNEEMSQVKLK